MHGHRRVAIAGGGAAAKALVKVLPAEIVDEAAFSSRSSNRTRTRVPDFKPSMAILVRPGRSQSTFFETTCGSMRGRAAIHSELQA